jgi:hypothetical protein
MPRLGCGRFRSSHVVDARFETGDFFGELVDQSFEGVHGEFANTRVFRLIKAQLLYCASSSRSFARVLVNSAESRSIGGDYNQLRSAPTSIDAAGSQRS